MKPSAVASPPSSPVTRLLELLLLGSLGLFAAGCGGGAPPLQGSLGDLVDLGYQSTQSSVTSSSLSIAFLSPRGTGNDTVLQLSANISGLTLGPKSTIDLSESPPGLQGQRGAVTRNVVDDPHQTLPTIERGQLLLDQSPDGATLLSGSFHVTFLAGTDFGAGRSVYGTFKAQVTK